jgi:predicted transcriptional regulator
MKTFRVALMVVWMAGMAAVAAPRVGGVLPPVRLSGKNGGLVSGKAWESTSMKGLPRAVFYVDPDEKDLNEHVGEAIQKAKFDKKSYGSVAIINMAATWLPNFAVARSLKAKQKKYPRTVYVKDLNKTMVQRWGLADNGYDVIVLDAHGTIRFYGRGKLSAANTKRVVETLRKAIADYETEQKAAKEEAAE